MDIKRKAYIELLGWKNSIDKLKAILIKCARRVGKSYLAELFTKGDLRITDEYRYLPLSMTVFVNDKI